MNRNVKWLVSINLALLVFALPLVELDSRVATARQQRPPTKARVSGSDQFRKNCARCHGADGRAQTPLGRTYQTPDLTDPEWWQKNAKITSTASLVSIVAKGKGGMPAFGRKLKRSEIRLLVNYVRRFRSRKP